MTIYSLNFQAMSLLLGWSLLNIFTGGWLLWRGRKWWGHFGQMCLLWNLVNLGIALYGLFGSMTQTDLSASLPEMLQASSGMQSFLAFNAGLDVAYVTLGFLLRNLRGGSSERLLAFGVAIILQGVFLFIFDLVLWMLHNSIATELSQQLAQCRL